LSTAFLSYKNASLILSALRPCLRLVASRDLSRQTTFDFKISNPHPLEVLRARMAASHQNDLHQVVPLNGAADLSAPMAGLVICCTQIPEEKRVGFSIRA